MQKMSGPLGAIPRADRRCARDGCGRLAPHLGAMTRAEMGGGRGLWKRRSGSSPTTCF